MKNLLEKLYENDIDTLEKKLMRHEKSAANQKKSIVIISVILVVFLIISIFYFKKQSILSSKKIIKSAKKEELNDIRQEKIVVINNELKKLEVQNFYLEKDCNLYNLAKKLNTNTSYLSKIINHTKKKTFNRYVNDLRIEYAIHKITKDKMFRSYSIKSIAEELGYKSADSFTKYFKQKTGDFPSAFIKKIKS